MNIKNELAAFVCLKKQVKQTSFWLNKNSKTKNFENKFVTSIIC